MGDEYTVMVSADSNGQVQAIVPVKVHTKRGITIDATTVDDIDVISAGISIKLIRCRAITFN